MKSRSSGMCLAVFVAAVLLAFPGMARAAGQDGSSSIDVVADANRFIGQLPIGPFSAGFPENGRVALIHSPFNRDAAVPDLYYGIIEAALVERLTKTRRLTVVECLECGEAGNGGASMQSRLKDIANRLELDGFIVWNVFQPSRGQRWISLRLVEGRTGAVLWSKQFVEPQVVEGVPPEDPERAFLATYDHYTLYLSMWGYSVERTLLAGGTPSPEVDRLLVLGSRLVRYKGASERIGYGMGMELVSSMNTEYADIWAGDVYAYLQWHLTTPVVDTVNGRMYSFANLYFSPGILYINSRLSELLKAGVELNIGPNAAVSIGAVYFPQREIWLVDNLGYAAGGKVGGTAFDLSLGLVF